MQLQRQAMEQRLGNSGNAVQNQAMAPLPPTASGQGYLTRSRQASAKGRSPTINQHGWDGFTFRVVNAANGLFFQRKLQLSH